MKPNIFYRVILMLSLSSLLIAARAQRPLNVCLAGLNHDHVSVAFDAFHKGRINIIGIAEPDRRLRSRIQQQQHLPDSIFYYNPEVMLKHRKPDVVMAYNPTASHLAVVRACAPQGISVIVEKPLALNYAEAMEIEKLAERYHIHVFTNYWTNWYASDRAIYQKVKQDDVIGPMQKLVFHDGHRGPKEIGVSPEFLSWLTDPAQNGGGAVMDFGCYGVNQLTWMMDNQLPVAVTAILRQMKPGVYPRVDDDATLIVEYPKVTGIILASWNFPFTLLDMEVYGKNGYLQAVDNDHIREKRGNTSYTELKPEPVELPYRDNISYLEAVLKGGFNPPADQASLKNNLVVMKILDAARLSAREGRRIVLAHAGK